MIRVRESSPQQVVWFTPEQGDVAIEAETAMHAILYAGEPVRQPVALRGPFVMNTMGEIMQAGFSVGGV